MDTNEYSMDAKAQGRRNFLKALGVGLGGALALGGLTGWWRYISGPKDRALFLFRRRSRATGPASEDSIFYPRDPEVRRKMSGSGRGV
ncbi:MAG: twin-arginine translocation signal domain-containing protein [Dehalococcoidia bacterium]